VPPGLWSTTEISVRDETDRLLKGTYFGIILFVLLFNLFLYMIIREKSSLYYVIYVFSLFMLQLSHGGFAFWYLWPELSCLANVTNPFFASMGILALIRFTQLFLNLKKFRPRPNRFYCVIGGLDAANILLSLVYTSPHFSDICAADKFAGLAAEHVDHSNCGARNAKRFQARAIFPLRIHCATDGYPDQFGGANNKKLKSQRLLDIIAKIADMSMAGQ